MSEREGSERERGATSTGPALAPARTAEERMPAERAEAPEPGVSGAGTASGAPDERISRRSGLAGYVDDFGSRLRSGELGSLPVLVGLVVIVIVFQSLNSVFL